MALGAIGKEFLRFAGPALKSSAGAMLKAGGTVGEEAAKAALGYGIQKFRPDLVGKATGEIPKLLRSTAGSVIPTVGRIAGQGAVIGTGLAAASMLDQQSEHTQPMPGMTGNKEMDTFLMKQQLAQQQFENEMRLTYAREEARIPGKQLETDQAMYKAEADARAAMYKGASGYGTGGFRTDVRRDAAEAERLYTDAGEITNREVQAIGRMIYGTGLRA
tara:strand:+ start:521 stop:1174 length:654 start_codon:yes stop_codon:yes gene_type:complete